MKKIILLSVIAITIAHCTSSKKTAKNTAPTPPPVVTVEANTVSKELQIAQKTWPGTTANELADGKEIYYDQCTKCHDAYEIVRFNEKKWLHEIDDMSPKARLTVDQKLKLTKYILSFREANTVVKPN